LLRRWSMATPPVQNSQNRMERPMAAHASGAAAWPQQPVAEMQQGEQRRAIVGLIMVVGHRGRCSLAAHR